ncbi:Glutamine synthetase nodule isozyme [Linum perenne]
MSSLNDLINLDLSDTTEKIIAEYIWVGGSGLDLRSKARVGPLSLSLSLRRPTSPAGSQAPPSVATLPIHSLSHTPCRRLLLVVVHVVVFFSGRSPSSSSSSSPAAVHLLLRPVPRKKKRVGKKKEIGRRSQKVVQQWRERRRRGRKVGD